MKKLFLTFDIEEFDLPREFNRTISDEDSFKISYEGCRKILELLSKYKLKGTFFISANFARKYPELIKEISESHEVGLHCYEHKDDYSKLDEEEASLRLRGGKEIIEKIIGKEIEGFRAPRFKPPKLEVISKLGFKYDSSLHPIWMPGRYNNFFEKRKIFNDKGLMRVPISVSPLLRLSIFWLAFDNLPLIYSKYVSNRNKKCVCLVFHSWEFVDVRKFAPYLVGRNSGGKLISKLEKYIEWNLKKQEKFVSVSDYLFNS